MFDDPNLVSHAGLVPVMALAERAGLGELTARHVRPGGPCGVNPAVKIGCLVAGMAAGADSIDDLDLLRHGAMSRLFGGIRAPSTLGSHLRAYTWGHVAQLEKVHREFLAELARQAPLLPGADTLAFIDVDSTQKRVYGYRKQGARFGYTKIAGKEVAVRGLNALAAAISTPLAAPVIAATRLRGGNAASVRGAAGFAAAASPGPAGPRGADTLAGSPPPPPPHRTPEQRKTRQQVPPSPADRRASRSAGRGALPYSRRTAARGPRRPARPARTPAAHAPTPSGQPIRAAGTRKQACFQHFPAPAGSLPTVNIIAPLHHHGPTESAASAASVEHHRRAGPDLAENVDTAQAGAAVRRRACAIHPCCRAVGTR